MVSTVVYSTARPTTSGLKQGLEPLNETDPVQLHSNASEAEKETVIRSIYRQVLGNAHVMESERLGTLESQLKQGQLSVREFVRQLAKSELYRSRFFEGCYRYRAIELNFKHLLGRAPNDFEEMRTHSTVLDDQGFAADIDTYLDSPEYQTAFGESIVPYYRGHQTRPGQSTREFTSFWQLLPSLSSSDKDLATNNKARLTQTLLTRPGQRQGRDANDILAEVFQPKPAPSQPGSHPTELPLPDRVLQQQIQEQAQQIATLQQQLAALRPTAEVGAAISGSWGTTAPTAVSGNPTKSSAYPVGPLQQQVNEQAAQIAALQEQVADARRYSAIADYRLNKWQGRSFRG